ncbi:uncharacterized protein [Leptinotarsa decemlineata]|uniref:uncharacterized protein n=1 Tax=Leptinotarsa decemlineata TaxID=7539 RepID=UPI003D3052FB
MGSPLSPIVANLYMEKIETEAIATSHLKPKLWQKYVDDIFVIWSHGHQELSKFFNHLNGIHPRIKFTKEVEEGNQLAFIDVLIMKKPDGTLGFTVYRKPTHTNRYLNLIANSHHHPKQIHAVAKTLTTRSRRLADIDHRQQELDTIETTLQMNNYSEKNIKAASKTIRKQQKTRGTPVIITTLLYIVGRTDKISRIFRRHNISTSFVPERTIRSMLRNAKYKIPLE